MEKMLILISDFNCPWRWTQWNASTPPGIEIVNPKDLGFSEEEIDKILGKVNLMGGGPNGNG